MAPHDDHAHPGEAESWVVPTDPADDEPPVWWPEDQSDRDLTFRP